VSHGLEYIEPKRRLMALHPRHWQVWRERGIVLGYVFTVDVAAAMLAAWTVAAVPVRPADVVRFGLLAAGALIHQEAVRHLKLLREQAAGDGVPPNLATFWIFAAALSVPLPLVFAITVVIYLHSWYRTRRGSLYRTIFSAATMVLAPAAAVAILQLLQPSSYPIIPNGPPGLALLIAAGAVYWLVGYALEVGAVMLTNPLRSARQALGHPADQMVVAAALGLAVAFALVLAFQPWLTVPLMLTVCALHRALLVPVFQEAARTDSKTGLLTAGFWREAADRELARARRLAEPLGVLMLDLDHFKSFNDRMGHLVGDQLLRAVADELRSETRPYDLVGRFGGEEFVILLPGVSTSQIEPIADRIRERISRLRVLVNGPHERPMTVKGLSVSIGAAVRPDDGDEVDRLLHAADSALLAAKAAGRDRVRLATR
jgi:diguanylate cyclase (GGDEF)-like protein